MTMAGAKRGKRSETAVLSALALAMQEGFELVLQELAKYHDNTGGPWIDELEARLMGRLEGSLVGNLVAEQPSDDLNPLAAANVAIRLLFTGLRAELARKSS
jgi:hypothetical protein